MARDPFAASVLMSESIGGAVSGNRTGDSVVESGRLWRGDTQSISPNAAGRPARGATRTTAREVLLIVVGLVVYFGVRVVVQDDGARALANFTNQYAAMPSFHFGWNLLAGLCLASTVRRRLLRALIVGLPFLTALAITATGNHYVVDAVAGGALALLGLAFARVVVTPPADDQAMLGRPAPVRPGEAAADQVL